MMQFLWQPLRVIWKILFFILFALSFLLLYPAFYFFLSNPKRFPRAFDLMRFWALIITGICGIWTVPKFEGKLPEGPFIICPNHSSYLDIIIMHRVFRRYFIFMGKAEILKWPLFGIFFTKGMNIPVDRASAKGSFNAFEKARQELKMGHNVVLFPEGTIPHTVPKMRAFKNGAFKLALEENIPIVPVTFVNNWKRLQAGPVIRQLGGPGSSKVIIHKFVNPADYKDRGVVELKRDIFETIQKPLIEAYGN